MLRWLRNILRHAVCLVIVLAISAVYLKLIPVNATTAALTFLLAVLLVATMWGFAQAGTPSVAAVPAVHFFFLPSRGAFTPLDPPNMVSLPALLLHPAPAHQLSCQATPPLDAT